MMWELFARKRPSEAPQPSRNVRRRLAFEGTVNATLGGFANLWTLRTSPGTDLSKSGSLFAEDAYIRKEYVELYDLIRMEFAEKEGRKTALVRGSSGIGKSAFLQYVVSRIRDEVGDVLVVQGMWCEHSTRRYLHLSTNWWGRKIATKLDTYEEARQVENKCSWTIVDGCDWVPIDNFAVGAASPSTPWKGFRNAVGFQLCMPLWSLDQLKDCFRQKSSDTITEDRLEILSANYELIGGIARWAFQTKDYVMENISSAVLEINFDTLQTVMTTQHATKTDAKELVHRLVSWSTPLDEDGKWMYRITRDNPIHYRLLSRFVSKQLAAKAATLSIEKRKALISQLKSDSAASAYRGVIFEADAIDRLVSGGDFQLRKCTNDQRSAHEVTLTLPNTRQRYAMENLRNLDVLDALNRIIVPDARNFESTDAFCVSSVLHLPADHVSEDIDPSQHEILQFQMTVGSSHPTKLKGVTDVFEKVQEGLPDSELTCAFIYVVPDDVEDSYLAPQSVLKVDGKVRVKRHPVFSDRNQYRLVIDYK